VRGLTTAAIVWVTAAVGMACGAGLALLACATTAGHFAVVLGYPAIGESTRRGFAVQRVTTQQLGPARSAASRRSPSPSRCTASRTSKGS
jgi:uncharacterized membrane protein YhiD involved in acid resistance